MMLVTMRRAGFGSPNGARGAIIKLSSFFLATIKVSLKIEKEAGNRGDSSLFTFRPALQS